MKTRIQKRVRMSCHPTKIWSEPSHINFQGSILATLTCRHLHTQLVGGFNPFEKYWSKWESSPNKDENKKYLKPPPRQTFVITRHNKLQLSKPSQNLKLILIATSSHSIASLALSWRVPGGWWRNDVTMPCKIRQKMGELNKKNNLSQFWSTFAYMYFTPTKNSVLITWLFWSAKAQVQLFLQCCRQKRKTNWAFSSFGCTTEWLRRCGDAPPESGGVNFVFCFQPASSPHVFEALFPGERFGIGGVRGEP